LITHRTSITCHINQIHQHVKNTLLKTCTVYFKGSVHQWCGINKTTTQCTSTTEWQLHCNLRLVAKFVVVLRNENYNLGLIHRSLKVCNLLNTVSMKREYCQCLQICNSSMPEIATSQLINITLQHHQM